MPDKNCRKVPGGGISEEMSLEYPVNVGFWPGITVAGSAEVGISKE
jgi:hypothetical protein